MFKSGEISVNAEHILYWCVNVLYIQRKNHGVKGEVTSALVGQGWKWKIQYMTTLIPTHHSDYGISKYSLEWIIDNLTEDGLLRKHRFVFITAVSVSTASFNTDHIFQTCHLSAASQISGSSLGIQTIGEIKCKHLQIHNWDIDLQLGVFFRVLNLNCSSCIRAILHSSTCWTDETQLDQR